jgi:hypothetical protein
MSYELFKAFANGMKDYIQQHNANATTIEAALNELAGLMTGTVAQVSVPLGLQEIFDRRGIIGTGSYDFNEGGLAGPVYNFTVAAGAYYNAGAFYHKASTTTLTMSGRANGTYYINLDALGNPIIGTSADATTSRQFVWDGSHISSKALYTGVSILFDGDDYADSLTSAARSKTFTKVADRLEEIEALLARGVQTPASADTVNINWSLGSHVRLVLDRATTTINMSGGYDGQKCVLELIQDATGGRGVSFGANIQPGIDLTLPAPLSVAPGKRDFLGFIYSAGNGKCDYVSISRGY